ncbi:glutamate racemase [Halanaerobium congolense]|uniref:Glutamate racemase n=2 Tax=Halanaerobium congolense TaxID=54121 RepID=A0A4R8GWL8_9FIRM|nr:aspartate/glutamate racemase family protein [Halanaerobium congolense]TDX48084.1 glutamate racemase [Halanaerobium congolense]
MKDIKLAVIAGTPYDTYLGKSYYSSQGYEVLSDYTSESPAEQNRLQYSNPEKLQQITLNKIMKLKAAGAKAVIIYCNSLSAVLDKSDLIQKSKLPLLTPLDVYQALSISEPQKIAVLAANSQSAVKIEKIIAANNPQLEFITAGIMPIINAIEAEIEAEKIYQQYGLKELIDSFQKVGADQLLLGCTHLPYLKSEIKADFNKIIDPAAEILELLLKDSLTINLSKEEL